MFSRIAGNWLEGMERRHKNVVAVVLANKNARTLRELPRRSKASAFLFVRRYCVRQRTFRERDTGQADAVHET